MSHVGVGCDDFFLAPGIRAPGMPPAKKHSYVALLCGTSAWSLAFACLSGGDDFAFDARDSAGGGSDWAKGFVACCFLAFWVATTILFSFHGTPPRKGRNGQGFGRLLLPFAAVQLHGAPRKGSDSVRGYWSHAFA